MRMNKPLVSVIMNAYNAERYLREAIDSVFAQTYDHWEIIFWDNCSTDATADIVHTYIDPRIHYFKAECFTPLGAARNEAITRARGELIAFLDCDDLWLPDKLTRQIPLFQNPDVGLVYSDAIYFNQDGYTSRLYENRRAYVGSCFEDLLLDYCLSLQTVVIRRETLTGLAEWFDPRFSMIEEYDLFVRIANTWNLDYVPEPLAKWRVHQESWTWSKRHLFVEEKKRLLEKFSKDVPFNHRYPNLFARLSYLFALDEAKFFWSIRESAKGRAILLSHGVKNKKACFIWILSFLPFHIVDNVYSRLKGRVRPS